MSTPSVKAIEDRPMLGIGLMLIAYFVFSNIDVSAKWLALLGIPFLQVAFMRYVGHFFISVTLISKDGFSLDRFSTDHFWLVFLRAFLLMASTVLNFLAVSYLPLTLTSTILFSVPIIICALSWPLLGERVGLFRWGAIMFGFVGILVAIRPFDESFHWAVFLSLGAAFCFAFYSILTRKLSGLVPIDILQFYAGAVGTFLLLPFAIVQWQNPTELQDWVIMIALGIFGWLGHQLMTQAHAYAPANLLMPFGYSFILFLTVWSYFVFDHLPDRYTIFGAAIIIIAGLAKWARERSLINKA